MRKIKYLSFLMCLFLLAACSDSEPTSKEASKGKEAETSEKESAEDEAAEETAAEDSEEAFAQEKYPVQGGGQFNKRDVVLYESENGKATFLGEMVDFEGYICAAVQLEGDLMELDSPFGLTFITNNSESIVVADSESPSSNIYGYRNSEKEKIVLLKSDDVASGTPARLDYTVSSTTYDEEGNEVEPEIKTVKLEETAEKNVIPDLMELDSSAMQFEISRSDDKKAIKLTGATISPDNQNEVIFTGTATYKADTSDIPVSYVQPATNKRDIQKIEDKAYADIPLEFEVPVALSSLGDDEGAIVYLAIDDFLFPIDLRTGKEYMGNIKLVDLPTTENNDFIEQPALEGIVDNDNKVWNNALVSQSPSWNYGLGTKEKEDISFITGGLFKELKVDIAAAKETNKHTNSYDIYFYDEDFETVQDSDEVNGKELVHYNLKNDSKTVNKTVDLSDNNKFTFYYNSNIPSENGDENYISVILANGELVR